MNKFVTPVDVARDASIVLSNLLVAGNTFARDKEAKFTGSKVGDSIKVTIPPVLGDADEFGGTTSATNIVESETDLTLEHHFYKRVDLTSKQKTLELSDFTRLVTLPVMRSFAQSIDKYIVATGQVFRANLAGSVANRPSTIAHIAAGTKALNDAFIDKNGRIMWVDTTVSQSLIQLAQFTSTDFGQDGPTGLRDATLGRRYGFTYIEDALLGAHDRGDIAGTVAVDQDTAAGSTQIRLDGFTNATGTIKAGTVFTLAGDTTRYVVRKDVAKSGNAAVVTIYPPLAAAADNNDLATMEAAGFQNIAFHPNATAAAIVAPEPLWGGNSTVQSWNGIGMRVSQDSSITTLSDSIVFDCFVGARVIQPNGGCLVAG